MHPEMLILGRRTVDVHALQGAALVRCSMRHGEGSSWELWSRRSARSAPSSRSSSTLSI